MIGYTDYDHADWVESNARAYRQNIERTRAERAAAGAKPRATKLPEKGWLTVPLPLPDWQRRAMHIIGMAWGGIYNAPMSWDAVDWGGGRHLHVPMRGAMPTFDSTTLTAFVFLCHAACIRGLIAPHTPGYLRVSMWPRARDGGTYDRHPTLAQAVEAFNAKLCLDHPVRFIEARGGQADG